MDECTRHRHAHSEMSFVVFAVCIECFGCKTNFVIFLAKCVTPMFRGRQGLSGSGSGDGGDRFICSLGGEIPLRPNSP